MNDGHNLPDLAYIGITDYGKLGIEFDATDFSHCDMAAAVKHVDDGNLLGFICFERKASLSGLFTDASDQVAAEWWKLNSDDYQAGDTLPRFIEEHCEEARNRCCDCFGDSAYEDWRDGGLAVKS